MLDTPHAPQSELELGSFGLSGVSYAFQGRCVLEDLDLVLEPGRFVGLLGPSGCGKSTLVRLLAGLLPIQQGQRIDPHGGTALEGIGLCFQEPRLLPWRNCLDNVGLALESKGVAKSEIQDRSAALLQSVGLGEALALRPDQLSGGMKMRVAVARALIAQPSLLILDEPFAALDAPTRFDLQSWLHELWREREMTVLLVTHSLEEAARLAQTAHVMCKQPGRIVHQLQFSAPLSCRLDTRTNHFASALIDLQRAMQQASVELPS